MMKRLLSLLTFTLLFCTGILAQSMSDDQVIEYVKSATDAGKSQKQIMTELAAKGVTRTQAERIKQRFEDQKSSEAGESAVAKNKERRRTNATEELAEGDMDIIASELSNPTEQSSEVAAKIVFGRNIFNSKALTFAPSQNIPTPVNYRLAAGDEVIIDIWGSNQATYREFISPDGNINISNVGPIYLNGMTIQEAEKYLKKELGKIYAGIEGENPTSEMKLTLGQIRTIQVNVLGEVAAPGTYNISSLSNIFHALYRAGGIGNLGSLRNIYLMRNGKKIASVDVYDFILKGKTMDATRLQEGDVIIVPPYEMLVDIQGNVKRPMFYEMKKGETVQTLIEYAGEFASDAYTKNIRITRLNGREYQIYTVDEFEYAAFELMDGDILNVNAMLDRFENKLEIKGAVYRPGIYQFGGKLNTVKQLVEKAEGIMGDAFLGRAILQREREDLTREVIQIDLKNILDGTKPDVALQRNDVLYIPSIHDLQDLGNVQIFGEVAKPGQYVYADNMTLEDLVIEAGGLLESASTVKVDIARRVRNTKANEMPSAISEIYTFGLKDGFVIDGEVGFTLEPYDQVYVRRSPGYQPQVNVSVEGEILYSGNYALSNKSERISDLVKKAGGITQFAYVRGAKLMRTANEEEMKRMADVMRIMQREMGHLTDSLKLDLSNVHTVGIDLEEALKNPGGDADLVLREGDRLIIPEMANTVKINGAVMLPNTISYKKGQPLKYYISQAGGFANGARKNKAFIIYMNGQAAKVTGSGKAQIEPGCEIIVPVKDKSKNSAWNLQNIMGFVSALASLGLTAAAIMNFLK